MTNVIVYKNLLGKVLLEVNVSDNSIIFKFSNEKWIMQHHQDCCEDVCIDDITGDLGDLLNEPLVQAEEVSEIDSDASESGTWTFYRFATRKGSVAIRWYGQSNGYYSESVDFEKQR